MFVVASEQYLLSFSSCHLHLVWEGGRGRERERGREEGGMNDRDGSEGGKSKRKEGRREGRGKEKEVKREKAE